MNGVIKQVVVLAAGEGLRLRPYTLTTPKPLLEVNGRPILEWNFDELPENISEIILVVGYLKDKIINHFGNNWRNKKIIYVEQHELKGTGDALRLCQQFLDEHFLVMNGDDLYAKKDLEKFSHCDLAILAKEISDPGRLSLHTLLTDEQNHFCGFAKTDENIKTARVNAGLYALNRHFFDYPLQPIKNGAEFGLPQTVALMAQDYPIEVINATFWQSVGYPEDIKKAEEAIKQKVQSSNAKVQINA